MILEKINKDFKGENLMKVAIHISHEALYKIGGIGEVLTGLCTAPSYQSFFEKTLFYGPL